MRKVLIIGHNVFDERTAFGKTLSSFFQDWDPNKLAQIYFHSEVPTSHICNHYYRITDKDILNSILRPWGKCVGKVFNKNDIKDGRSSSRTDSGVTRKLYSLGRKRTSGIYLARNAVWTLGNYKNDALINWIRDFSPDVIFFAAGDYAFAYDLTRFIAHDFNIPVIMYCCDDYYINRLNPDSKLSNIVYKGLMKSVNRLSTYVAAIITICDKMTEEYKKIFDVPIYTVYTGYSHSGNPEGNGDGIVYLGNLGFSRYSSLIDIGKALQRIDRRYFIHVYSAEERPHILEQLNKENGIIFHGSVDKDDVIRIISESMLVVHTESFLEQNIYKIQYSVSTKIADLLASGRCIFAYGPNNIASMEYLLDNDAAFVVNSKDELIDALRNALTQPYIREKRIQNAKRLAEDNHSPMVVTQKIREIIDNVGAL